MATKTASTSSIAKKRPALKGKTEATANKGGIKGKASLPAKRTSPAAKKAPAKKASTSKAESAGRDKYGYLNGSLRSIICAELLKGGASKDEVVANVEKALKGKTTRNGNPYNAASMVTSFAKTFVDEDGFTLRDTGKSYKLVPPAKG